jgi:hypothetical protein
MPVIAVDHATASVRRSACRPTWTLDLFGPGRGRSRNRVRLVFSPSIGLRPGPTVGYVTDNDDAGISVVGWLPALQFPAYRRILDEGGPLEVHYEARDREGAGYLRRLGIARDHEVLAARTARPRQARGRSAPRRPSVAFSMPI